MTENDIMQIIRTSDVDKDTSWSVVAREFARCLAGIGDRLTSEELAAMVKLAALSYQKARADYQASIAYDLLMLRMKGRANKRSE